MESQLKRAEQAEAQARDKLEKEKAKRFSKRIQSRVFMKQPQAVSLAVTQKKRKMLKTKAIRSADEEDVEDPILEGFHLQEESPHCLNMTRSEDYQAYLRHLVLESKRMLKAGGADMHDAYLKIIESFYWVCKANKQTIVNGAEPKEVLQSIKDPKCKAYKMKLNERRLLTRQA